MKAAQLNYYDGKDAISISELPIPTVSSGKVMVKIRAAGVNPFDWKMQQGYMQKSVPLSLPITLGGDFSGEVAEAGFGIFGLSKGDEVFGSALVLSGGTGSFAQFAVADGKYVAKKPKRASHLEAAAVPLAGSSAWQALFEHMSVSRGSRILIHGASGGIGSFAVQIARNIGAHVAATANAAHADYVKQLGASVVIDYKAQSFENMLEDYDAVYDTVGGETYRKSFKVLKKGGTIVSMLEQPDERLMQEHKVKAIYQSTRIRSDKLSKLAEMIDRGSLKVHIGKSFPLDEAAEALEFLQKGHPQGKVVLEIS